MNLRESSFEALLRADLSDLLRGLPGLGVGLLAGVSAAGAGVTQAGAGELHVHGELEYRGFKRRLAVMLSLKNKPVNAIMHLQSFIHSHV